MAAKWQTQMTTVGDALRGAYAELGALGNEIAEWSYSNGPSWRTDNTNRGFHLRHLAGLLQDAAPPDFTCLPDRVMAKEICININVGEKGRGARRDNALARLRPAASVLEKEGFPELAATVRQHVYSLDVLPFPRAFERGW